MQTQSYERINILVPKDTAKRLRQAVPRGKRSKLITEAIDEKLQKLNRKDMYKELLKVRQSMPKVSTEEIVRWIREDRESH